MAFLLFLVGMLSRYNPSVGSVRLVMSLATHNIPYGLYTLSRQMVATL